MNTRTADSDRTADIQQAFYFSKPSFLKSTFEAPTSSALTTPTYTNITTKKHNIQIIIMIILIIILHMFIMFTIVNWNPRCSACSILRTRSLDFGVIFGTSPCGVAGAAGGGAADAWGAAEAIRGTSSLFQTRRLRRVVWFMGKACGSANSYRYQISIDKFKTNPEFSKGLGKKRKTLSHQTIMNEHLQYPLLIGILRVPPTWQI